MPNSTEIYNFLKFKFSKEFSLSPKISRIISANFLSLESLVTAKDDLENKILLDGTSLSSVFSDNDVQNLKDVIDTIDLSKTLHENYISSIGSHFLQKQFKMIDSINIDALNINPFLISLLNFSTHKEMLKFLVFSRAIRSIVTSLGMAFEELIMAFGWEKSQNEFDLQKIINKITHFIQVKSGTNTMNKDQVNVWASKILNLEKTNPNAKCWLGFPYGKRSDKTVTLGLLKRYFSEGLQSNTLIVSELWDSVSSQKITGKEILNTLNSASDKILNEVSIMSKLEKRIDILCNELETRFVQDSNLQNQNNLIKVLLREKV